MSDFVRNHELNKIEKRKTIYKRKIIIKKDQQKELIFECLGEIFNDFTKNKDEPK